MNALLEQFLAETKEALQAIADNLLQLEKEPANDRLLSELFRLVHTLKGNSGLFDLPELTRVLHAGEDLLDAVRQGQVGYSRLLADRLLDAADYVGMLCDEFEAQGRVDSRHIETSVGLAEALRQLIAPAAVGEAEPSGPPVPRHELSPPDLPDLPEAAQAAADHAARQGLSLHWLCYRPLEECFFQGDDPFHQARLTPGLVWGGIAARQEWPDLAEFDPYRCLLDFRLLSSATLPELEEHFRYVSEQVKIVPLPEEFLRRQQTTPGQQSLPEELAAESSTSGFPDNKTGGTAPFPPAVGDLLAAQREILTMPDDVPWLPGRIKAAAASLTGCLIALGRQEEKDGLETALNAALAESSSQPLLAWLNRQFPLPTAEPLPQFARISAWSQTAAETLSEQSAQAPPVAEPPHPPGDGETKFGRRADDVLVGAKSIKVDQFKIDRLMNLIGEMVVAKNALPYLADRAETIYGIRDLSREIKAQYAIIHRIAGEMQDSIMQVRMMPISLVLQRFHRLVRDTSQKLGKQVNLVLQGEETEADKNVIEALGDPLVHIVRNSLDHGIESPDHRRSLGKPATGTIVIRASQESDRVIIEISDDGRGIDPLVIKHKAYEKGILNAEQMARISDQEAVNLVFAAGFSTAETVSDLSGRGVGMDVVRNAVEKVNGILSLESEKGKGTRLRLSLPLSMAVTNVMIVETNRQIFGVPMESVLETVRVPTESIYRIKEHQAIVLRGRIVPLLNLNSLLDMNIPPETNAEGELAVLLVRHAGESVGIIVDDFRETVEIILKPMHSVLTGLAAYAGSALLGNGSVLLVLDIKEILSCR